MFAKAAYVGFILLSIGLAIGIFGAITPISAQAQQSATLVNTPIGVDPNDYATQNLQMTKGQTVGVYLSIENQSLIFSFDIMNQTQYYIWYGCAPQCYQPMLGGTGSYNEQAKETNPYLVNVTITPTSPYKGSFTAPANGTYYFVFDNSIGSSWSTYVNHDASGYAVGKFGLVQEENVSSHSVNWIPLGAGSILMLAGGAIPALFWKDSPQRRRLTR